MREQALLIVPCVPRMCLKNLGQSDCLEDPFLSKIPLAVPVIPVVKLPEILMAVPVISIVKL